MPQAFIANTRLLNVYIYLDVTVLLLHVCSASQHARSQPDFPASLFAYMPEKAEISQTDLERSFGAAAAGDWAAVHAIVQEEPASPSWLYQACDWASQLMNHTSGRDSIQLRVAEASDMSAVLGLVQELAEYEKEPDAVVTSVEQLQRDGFGSCPLFAVILAEQRGGADDGEPAQPGASEHASAAAAASDSNQVIGMAFIHHTYSTWRGLCLYLEDLYVRPSARGSGVGTALVRAVAATASAAGAARLVWQCLDWNEPAMKMYTSKFDAQHMVEWNTLRLEGFRLTAAAAAPAAGASE